MHAIQHTIQRARTRMVFQSALDDMGKALLIAVILAFITLVLDRAMSLSLPWWGYALIPGAALILAPITAWVRRPDSATVAATLDHRLKLKDQIATALYAERMPDDPFAKQVVESAQRTATGLDLRDAFRLRWGRAWAWVPPVAALMALVAVFMNPMDLLGRAQAQAQREQEADAARVAEEQVVNAVAAVRSMRQENKATTDPETTEALNELAALTQRDLKNPEMRRQAVAKLSKVQEKLAAEAEQQESQFNTMQSMLSRLETDGQGPADKFADALRRGDFEAAKEALEDLAKNLDNMSPDERAALERQLGNLAQQLAQAAQAAAQQQAQQQQQMQQALQNAGLSQQQIQQLAQQNYNQQAVQQALQQNGMSQQQAQQTAQQIQKQQQQSQNASQCQNTASGLSSSLQKMSQSASPSQNQSQNQSQSQSQNQNQNQSQNQSNSSSQNFSQAAGQCSSQMSSMAQMQSAMQKMQQSQGQLSKASSSMGGQQPNPFNQPNPFQQPQGGGKGGSKAGTADGGNPVGAHERELTGYQTEHRGDIGQGEGKVIASWMENGEMAKGEAKQSFDQAVTAARSDAEQAITEDRVPRRYHEAVREYFNQLPQTPEKAAPKAPR